MNEHMQSICDSLDFAYRDLAKVNQQIRNNNGELTPSSNEYLDRLTHTIKSLETTKAMKEAAEEQERGEYGNRGGYGMTRMRYPGGYYPGSMYPVGGYRDGYGRNPDRDSSGRYATDGNMRDKLRAMMANTRDENTRQEIQRMMDNMA